MKKQALKIQQVNSLIACKKYQNAFKIMYREALSCTTIAKGYDMAQKIMEERTNGNFLNACAIFEDAVEMEEIKIEKQRKSAKVRDFLKKYKNWESGYSMGETVKVVYKGNLLSECDTIKNSQREYLGAAKRWNNNIQYGEATLFVDLTGNRAKYRVEIIEKR